MTWNYDIEGLKGGLDLQLHWAKRPRTVPQAGPIGTKWDQLGGDQLGPIILTYFYTNLSTSKVLNKYNQKFWNLDEITKFEFPDTIYQKYIYR